MVIHCIWVVGKAKGKGSGDKLLQVAIEDAKEHFGKLLEEQLQRVERMKKAEDWIDYTKLKPIIIGIIGGDGIGPFITIEAQHVLEFLLKKEIENGNVELKVIEGLTIEKRTKALKTIPDDVLAEIKKCHVLLKGPTYTPKKGDKWPNIESANVAMRRILDLFANVRPVKVPRKILIGCSSARIQRGLMFLVRKALILHEVYSYGINC